MRKDRLWFFWKIKQNEFKKVIPLSIMMFCIIYIYSLCRDLKDTLLVSKSICGGAEVLGFVKLFIVTPAAAICMLSFVILSNKFSKEKLFRIVVVSFLIFFAAFGFVLYPANEIFHMSKSSIESLQKSFPNFHWMWPVLGNWIFSLFYVVSEMWASVVLSALFWQIANEFTTVEEAKRHYSFFGFVGNFGLLFSGSAIIFFAELAKRAGKTSPTIDPFLRNIKYQMLSVVFLGIVLYLTHLYFYRENTIPALKEPRKTKKYKLNFLESMKHVFTSKYLLMIVVIVVAYGISMSLLESIWKGQVKLYYPDTNSFHSLMGKLSLLTAIVTLVTMIAGSYVLRFFSWRTAALITPVVLVLSSIVFFVVIIYENKLGLNATICGCNILLISVVTGLIREAFSRGAKYSLFDSTKQMAYIPLDSEIKAKDRLR